MESRETTKRSHQFMKIKKNLNRNYTIFSNYLFYMNLNIRAQSNIDLTDN